MKKFIHKAKASIGKLDGAGSGAGPGNPGAQQPMQDQPSKIQSPSPVDVYRYRYQHGTNLGSVFVLEKWLTPSMYSDGSDSAELAAVTGNVKQFGLKVTKDKFEKHWNEYCSDADLDWLANEAKCTSIRLPIGYFTLGPAYCQGTPFASSAGVYENAWSAVRKLVSRCASRGIGVLLDLHALPGGANGGDHSGTNSGKAAFWRSSSNQDLATRCLLFIAKEAHNMDGVIGIQIVNEAEWNAHGMYKWYDSVISQISNVDSSMPVYISDAWDLGKCVDYTLGKNNLHSGPSTSPVVIDTHLYWAFSDDDKRKAPKQISQEARSKLSELDGKDGSVADRGAVSVVIGEYSCVMTEDSWARGRADADEKHELVKEFGQAQSQRYQSRAGGSFFWTYRMDWMDGGEWGLKHMTKTHAITPPANLALSHSDIQNKISHAVSQRDPKFGQSFSAHRNYWDGNHPGEYEHFRYEAGWYLGFEDALAFFGMRAKGGIHGNAGGDKIGMLDLWVRKRIWESGQAHGKFLWEWEQGFRQGVRDFYELAGV